MKWYVMYKGKFLVSMTNGKKQVSRFSSNTYKGHETKEQAEASYLKHLVAGEGRNRMKTRFIVTLFMLIIIAFQVYVLVV
jgi:hypothetical protein